MEFTLSKLFEKRNFTPMNLACYLGSDKENKKRAGIEFLQYFNVIPTLSSEVSCSCGTRMVADSDTSVELLGFNWVCPNNQCPRYNSKVTPLENTFLSHLNMCSKHNLDLVSVLLILSCWIYKLGPLDVAYKYCGCAPKTARTCYSYFRKIARVAEGHDQVKIGGATDVIELGDSNQFIGKYIETEGRVFEGLGRIGTETITMPCYGGISRITKKRFAFRVPCRERESLLPKLAARVKEDSFIISDVGKDYIQCPRALNFKGHSRSNLFAAPNSAVVPGLDPKLGVNYVRTTAEKIILVPSENVDPEEEVEIKVHANNVKRMWKDLMEHMETMRGPKYTDRFEVDDCIAEWVYRKNTLEEGAVGSMDRGEQLRRFFKDVCRVYPGPFKNGIKENRQNCLCDECQFMQ